MEPRTKQTLYQKARLFSALLAAIVVAATLASPPSVTAMGLEACSADATDSDGDGFGWEPNQNLAERSCVMGGPILPDPDCDYSQAEVNNDWGWNPITKTPCEPADSELAEPTTTTTPEVPTPEPEDNGGCPVGWPQGNTTCDLAIADSASIMSGTNAALPLDDRENHGEVGRNNAGFRTRCFVSHYSYSDPLVHPANPTSDNAHLHMFFGNTATDANSVNGVDPNQDNHLLDNASSTCGDLGEHNRSAYWIPALFNNIGEVVNPTQINVYYKTLAYGGRTFTAASEANSIAVELLDMRTVPNDLQMIASGGKINIEQRDGKLWLIARIEFHDCIRLNPNGSALGTVLDSNGEPLPRGIDLATGSNYDSFKDWNHECDASNTGASIPGLEYNIQWEIQGTDLQFENGVVPPTYEEGNNNRLGEGGWTFSNGIGWDDVLDENAVAPSNSPWKWTANNGATQLVHPELQPSADGGASLHGDYMAAWEGNDSWNTATGAFNDSSGTSVAEQDAMSQLRISNQRPVSAVFSNEFPNLHTIRFDPLHSTSLMSDDSVGGLQRALDNVDSYVIDALRLADGAAIPCEIDGAVAPNC